MSLAVKARCSPVGHARTAGFSLIELMVVIAIMSVLATVGLPLAELSHQRSKEEELRRSLREIRSALDDYKRMVDQGRISRTADASGYPPDLKSLVDGVPDATSAQRAKLYFLRKLPRDPFAAAEGHAELGWGVRSYASSSKDPKPGSDVYDIYSMSPGVGLNGIPYREW